MLRAQCEALSASRPRELRADDLGMSVSHFDKCCSLLLAKCYERIAELRAQHILPILATAGLHKNYVHELRQRDRSLHRRSAKRALIEWYHTAVNTYLLFEVRLFDERVWKHIGDRYCELVKSGEARTLVQLRTMIRQSFVHYVQGDYAALNTRDLPVLEKIRKEIQNKAWPECHIVAGTAMAQIHTALGNMEVVVQWWLFTIAQLKAHPEVYPQALAVARGSLAQASLRLHGPKAAQKVCEEIWKENNEVFARNGHLNLVYFRVSLLCSDVHRAGELLKMRFGRMDVAGKGLVRPMDAVDFALYSLSLRQPLHALEYVQEGLSLSAKMYAGFEADIRFLECVTYAFLEDFPHALQRIDASLRFLRSKKANPESTMWSEEFRYLRSLLQAYTQGRPIPSDVRHHYGSLAAQSVDVFSNAQMLCWKTFGS